MSVTVNGTSGLTFNDASTQNTAATGFGFKNRIINGNMRIDQRNAGASVTPTTSGTYTLDRWITGLSQASKFSVQQGTSGVAAVNATAQSNYLAVTSTSAYTLLSTDQFNIQQRIEGFNIADLGWGYANAKPVTISFYVNSSLTGTFGGSLRNNAADRSYPFTYSIPVASTWTVISITIPGDTTGTWLTTNGIGVSVIFGLGVGTTLSGTAGAWAAANYLSATGAVSVVSTSGAILFITGVQLEKGSTATSYDLRPYGTELQLCQRYYWQQSSSTTFTTGFYRSGNTSLENNKRILPVPMRVTPNCTATSITGTCYTNGTSASVTGLTAITGDDNLQINIVVTTAASIQGLPGWLNITSVVTATAEL